MSNAKVRARRRRRANRAWTRAMQPEVYSVISCDYAAHEAKWLGVARRELQTRGLAVWARETMKLLREEFPGALQVGDELIVECPAEAEKPMIARLDAAMKAAFPHVLPRFASDVDFTSWQMI